VLEIKKGLKRIRMNTKKKLKKREIQEKKRKKIKINFSPKTKILNLIISIIPKKYYSRIKKNKSL
jgi:hypothetical protein